MKTRIQATNFSADQKLLQFVEERLNKLGKLYERALDGEVFLKLNNEKIKNKTAEIRIHIPGNQLFASEHAASFEEAVDSTIEALRRQLRRLKGKQTHKKEPSHKG